MKLNYTEEERTSLEKICDYSFINPTFGEYMKGGCLKAQFKVIHRLCVDCNALEAEIRRLQDLYESDDLK